MKTYLLDTNTIIYAQNLKLKFPKGKYLISIITEIELLSYDKLSKTDDTNLRKLFSRFEIINISENIKEKTIQIRKNFKFKLPDSLIVATAIENDAILITSDKQLLNSGILNIIDFKDLLS